MKVESAVSKVTQQDKNGEWLHRGTQTKPIVKFKLIQEGCVHAFKDLEFIGGIVLCNNCNTQIFTGVTKSIYLGMRNRV